MAESLAAEQDQDSDEEEVIILVELNQLPNPDVIKEYKGTCSILGIETEEPILQLDNYVFKGKFEDTLGSHMFFKQEADSEKLSYVCKASKKLSMSRVVLKKKEKERKREESSEIKDSPDTPMGDIKEQADSTVAETTTHTIIA